MSGLGGSRFRASGFEFRAGLGVNVFFRRAYEPRFRFNIVSKRLAEAPVMTKRLNIRSITFSEGTRR